VERGASPETLIARLQLYHIIVHGHTLLQQRQYAIFVAINAPDAAAAELRSSLFFLF